MNTDHKLLNYKIRGIKCDHPSCDYHDDSINWDDLTVIDYYLKTNCPKCGSPLLTEKDAKIIKFVISFVDAINWLYNFFMPSFVLKYIDEKFEMYKTPIDLDGSGKVHVRKSKNEKGKDDE